MEEGNYSGPEEVSRQQHNARLLCLFYPLCKRPRAQPMLSYARSLADPMADPAARSAASCPAPGPPRPRHAPPNPARESRGAELHAPLFVAACAGAK